ncbi:hypothetical protein EJF36_17200 [Bacillus sp. HMF5848]|uniref:hypothetical protein n=1 Tax=Bacillus sp. HMF5848 TaxID=2495421 RepID=UPI000F7B3760|nr:hypothetical protein [Bacillus sp. HMF5848]RSK28464.1 hypothetical protein EJF36_17200 [Bacillus sp. HMF5848]
MSIKEDIRILLKQVQNIPPIQALLPSQDVFVTIECEETIVSFKVSKEECSICSDSSTDKQVIIRLLKHDLDQILQGELRLRQLQQMSNVSVSGTWRQIFLLDALFYLVGKTINLEFSK